ncbi:IS200/IS605 family transposase [Chloroflexus aggregans]|uniref:Transposase IS200-family protein n=1 Tax=Chloroflexus aggregans (strain MD-66 / DSM 9485) TaxID=326427 RepID=B8G7H7_CHLAD|nr:IS200/IS605 family transposase [Chloroflexus aggregans]ACL26012.1 transposase IS200-family protein [Chloroflexus aggregans DSM 9485]
MKQMDHSNDPCGLLINSHLVWCPKRRRKMVGGRRTTRLEELIRETAPELGCAMVALEIMPDHLHPVVSATPHWVPNHIVSRFKGKTSRIVRQEFPFLRRMPSLGTRSYFWSTARHVSADTIRRYSEAQRTRG